MRSRLFSAVLVLLALWIPGRAFSQLVLTIDKIQQTIAISGSTSGTPEQSAFGTGEMNWVTDSVSALDSVPVTNAFTTDPSLLMDFTLNVDDGGLSLLGYVYGYFGGTVEVSADGRVFGYSSFNSASISYLESLNTGVQTLIVSGTGFLPMQIVAIPEPTPIFLILSGFVGFCFWCGWLRRQKA